MSIELSIAFIAAGSALLGTSIAAGLALWGVHLQTKRAREFENIRRIREVKDKRIDKIEELLNYSTKYSLGLLEICKQYAEELPDKDFIKFIKDEIVSEKKY